MLNQDMVYRMVEYLLHVRLNQRDGWGKRTKGGRLVSWMPVYGKTCFEKNIKNKYNSQPVVTGLLFRSPSVRSDVPLYRHQSRHFPT